MAWAEAGKNMESEDGGESELSESRESESEAQSSERVERQRRLIKKLYAFKVLPSRRAFCVQNNNLYA